MSNVIDRLENKEDLELAKAAQRCLVSALDHSRAVQIAVLEEGAQDLGDAPLLRLPPNVLRLFADVLGTLAQGKGLEHTISMQNGKPSFVGSSRSQSYELWDGKPASIYCD